MWTEIKPLHLVKRAASEHECQFCWWPIPAGDPYYRAEGTFEGFWHTFKAHVVCEFIWQSPTCLDDRMYGESSPEPGAWRELLSHVGVIDIADGASAAVVELVPGAFWEGDGVGHLAHHHPCERCGR